MTTTDTQDVAGTVAQIEQLVEAGCELVRVTVNHDRAADALPEIRAACPVPLIADIHFTHRRAPGSYWTVRFSQFVARSFSMACSQKVRPAKAPGSILTYRATPFGLAIRIGPLRGLLKLQYAP